TAAGLSVLRRLRDESLYDELERRSARLADGLKAYGRVQRVGAMLAFFGGDGWVRSFQHLDAKRYGTLFRGLLERGIYIAPSPCCSATTSTRRVSCVSPRPAASTPWR